ncbi:MAG: hypothetical protein AAGI53_13085 [Planctomycetota bacterium]
MSCNACVDKRLDGLRFVLLVVAVGSAAAQSQPIDLGLGFLDHEILVEENLIVYQTPDGEIWTQSIDPATGLFVAGDDRSVRIDVGVAPLTDSKNGPEFGLDAGGWTVFYNKSSAGRVQVWRATFSFGAAEPFDVVQLTSGNIDRINQLPSQWSGSPTTYAIYARSNPDTGSALLAWFDEAAPDAENPITPVEPNFAGFRWIDNTSMFTSTIAGLNPDRGQIVLTDAAGGPPLVITNDPGIKFDPYGWVATDFGDELRVIAKVDLPGALPGEPAEAIAVYAPGDGLFWEQTALLQIPASSGMTHVQSPEPFVVGGRSFVVTTLKDADGPVIGGSVRESQVWLFDLNDDPETGFVFRCDDGVAGAIAHEGEAFAGTDELMIYYNYVSRNGDGIGMALAPTGIGTSSACRPVDLAPPFGRITPADTVRFLELFEAADSTTDFDGNGSIDFFDVLAFTQFGDACVGSNQPVSPG